MIKYKGERVEDCHQRTFGIHFDHVVVVDGNDKTQ